ncbi:hypothetical protein T492DRAFT_858724 [Pavlovales sp. CCMP2436]|nr:hypothetical protein T492DRAFT_858724 [Pavlovales sp. CCMP2436]
MASMLVSLLMLASWWTSNERTSNEPLQLKIQYHSDLRRVDDTGDVITISCADDFGEAVRLLEQGNLNKPSLPHLVLVDLNTQEEKPKQEL